MHGLCPTMPLERQVSVSFYTVLLPPPLPKRHQMAPATDHSSARKWIHVYAAKVCSELPLTGSS